MNYYLEDAIQTNSHFIILRVPTFYGFLEILLKFEEKIETSTSRTISEQRLLTWTIREVCRHLPATVWTR